MKTWDEMTEDEKDAANEHAYADAGEAVRAAFDAFPDADFDGIRQYAYDVIEGDIAEARRLVKRGQRTRATKTDKWIAESAAQRIAHAALVQGFIWDVEV